MSTSRHAAPPPSPMPRTPRRAAGVDRWQSTVEFVIGTINVVAFLAGVLLIAGLLDGPWRTGAAVILCLLGPGAGLVQVLGYFDTVVRATLVIGLSLATSVLVAQVLLTVHRIDVMTAAIPLTIITAIGLILRLIRLAGGRS